MIRKVGPGSSTASLDIKSIARGKNVPDEIRSKNRLTNRLQELVGIPVIGVESLIYGSRKAILGVSPVSCLLREII